MADDYCCEKGVKMNEESYGRPYKIDELLNNEKASDTWVPPELMLIGNSTICFKEETEHGDRNYKRRNRTDL